MPSALAPVKAPGKDELPQGKIRDEKETRTEVRVLENPLGETREEKQQMKGRRKEQEGEERTESEKQGGRGG